MMATVRGFLRRFVRWLASHPCGWVTGLLVFVAFPGIDLFVSGLFFDDGRFFLRYAWPMEFIRAATPALTIGFAVFIAVLGVAAVILKDTFLGVDGGRASYLVSSLILGPGVLVNGVFKEYWGRARPSTITDFGGDRLFSPAMVVTDQCVGNCSFVSGHAAMAFWGIAVALLAPPAWRRAALLAAVAYGSLVGFVRIAQGAHFLSDVVFAGALTAAVSLALRRLILADPHSRVD